MRRNYHPDYEKIAKLYDDNVKESKKVVPFKNVSQEIEHQLDYSKIVLFILVVCLSGVSITLYLKANPDNPKAIPINELEVPRDLEKEVDKMRLVLSDLVLTVETLIGERVSKELTKESLNLEVVTKVIKVTTPSANLREEPNLQSKTVSIINKDTELLLLDRQGDWIKTYSPSGRVSWIHASVVTQAGGDK